MVIDAINVDNTVLSGNFGGGESFGESFGGTRDICLIYGENFYTVKRAPPIVGVY